MQGPKGHFQEFCFYFQRKSYKQFNKEMIVAWTGVEIMVMKR